MNIIIYHGSIKIRLIENIEFLQHINSASVYQIENLDALNFFQLLTKDDNHEIVLIYPSEEALLNKIKSEFILINAAGGLVYNEKNELLLIHRLGKWDLPKGKIEKNEQIEECALREVTEETGLRHIQLIDYCATTYHTYVEKSEYILKETFWYFMKQTKPNENLLPQIEEGIEQVRWVAKKDLDTYKQNTYENIKAVINQFYLHE